MTAGGAWVFVCGPSGAGKDSVIECARAALDSERRVVFARRLVTRAAGPGSDHDEISPGEFARMRDANALAWHWQAHGHGYGIAAGYARLVEAGRVVVVNGSRVHAARLAGRADVQVALVTAPDQVVGERLRSRAREDGAAIARRLERNAALASCRGDLVIDNSGSLARAGAQLAHWLLALARADQAGASSR